MKIYTRQDILANSYSDAMADLFTVSNRSKPVLDLYRGTPPGYREFEQMAHADFDGDRVASMKGFALEEYDSGLTVRIHLGYQPTETVKTALVDGPITWATMRPNETDGTGSCLIMSVGKPGTGHPLTVVEDQVLAGDTVEWLDFLITLDSKEIV